MHSPRALVPKNESTARGLPGSWLADLSPCAVPNHPGEPGGCSRPLLHHRRQASSPSGRLAALTLRNEAESGSLALRLTDSLRQASLGGLLRSTLARLPVEWAITGQAPFSLLDQPGFSWRTRRSLFSVCASQPFPHVIQLFQQTIPSPSKEELTVRTSRPPLRSADFQPRRHRGYPLACAAAQVLESFFPVETHSRR